MTAINRVPAGVPAGGQFTEGHRAEADRLTDPTDDAGFEQESATYHIPLNRLDAALETIDKANRRLEREGIDARFTTEVVTHHRTRRPTPEEERTMMLSPGMQIDASYAEVTLDRPVISQDGWRFEAALDRLPGTESFTVRSAGTEFGGWKPEAGVCDHCQQKRSRNTTYLLAHEDGRQMQVGSTCIESFLGVKPKGLWSMQFDPLPDREPDTDTDGPAFSPGEPVVDNRQLISEMLAVSDGGKAFVSRSSAQYSDRMATIDELDSLQSSNRRHEYAKILADAQKYEDDGTVDEVIAAACELDQDSDYGQNMHTVLDAGFSGARTRALLGSAIAVWRRKHEKQATPEAAPKPGFLAPVKERVRDVPAKVTRLRYFETSYGYQDRLTTIVTMRADGHEVVWFASNDPDISEGDEVSMTATVKKHDSYRGTDQTVVTRAKLTPRQTTG